MNPINKTLYIPLYAKAKVSSQGIILKDPKAEEIQQICNLSPGYQSESKWLAYFLSMRAAVFDRWTKNQIRFMPDAVVLHIGCGLDSRVLRIGKFKNIWYDIDFPDVIRERKKYFSENSNYHMLYGDASDPVFLDQIPESRNAIVILEGVSMYLRNQKICDLFLALQNKFQKVSVFMDVYTEMGVKATRIKNPIRDVGVTHVYSLNDPEFLMSNQKIRFTGEYTMTPEKLVNQLKPVEKLLFSKLFAGKTARIFYRLFEYEIYKEKNL